MRLLLGLWLVWLSSWSIAGTVYHFSGETMGTTYNVKVSEFRPIPLKGDMEVLLKEVNRQMSTYLADSEISQFNHSTKGHKVVIAEGFRKVVSLAKDIFRRTDGAFDPTIGPIVNLWGFGPQGRPETIPSQDSLAKALQNVGFDHISLVGATLERQQDGVYLDLSAIAKGYGVDVLAQYLESRGIFNYMVEIGGELRTRGMKSQERPWLVGIEAPSSGPRTLMRVVNTRGRALATSGDYRNYYEKDGVRWTHILDPRTGKPVAHGLASVSVLADTCAEADGLATAMMVLGPEKSMALARRDNLPLFMIIRQAGGFTTQASPSFKPFLVQ